MKKILFCLLLIFVQLAPADQLNGRLFSSPAERNNLDQIRKIKKPIAPITITTPAESQQIIERVAIELPESISMQGYVKRNDGIDSTVWINNQATTENSRIKDVQVGKVPEDGNRVPIKLTANGKRLNLKAGQVYESEGNRVREARNNSAQGDAGNNDEGP